MFEHIAHDHATATKCRKLSNEVYAALQKYAVGTHGSYGNILAYEVDGYGDQLFMDDANVPGLLSLPSRAIRIQGLLGHIDSNYRVTHLLLPFQGDEHGKAPRRATLYAGSAACRVPGYRPA